MATGTATLDFGSSPVSEAQVDVTGLSGLSASSYLEAFVMSEATAGNSAQEHRQLASIGRFVCEYLSATSFRIYADLLAGFATGQFTLRYVTA